METVSTVSSFEEHENKETRGKAIARRSCMVKEELFFFF